MENENTTEKKKASPMPALIIIVIFAVIFASCSISNNKWRVSKEKFKALSEETLELYGEQISSYYVDGMYVGVYFNTESYDNATDRRRKAVMEEIVKLIRVNAYSSGIYKYGDVTVSFYRTQNDRIKMYTIKKE